MQKYTYTQWKYPYGFSLLYSDFPIPKNFHEDPKL